MLKYHRHQCAKFTIVLIIGREVFAFCMRVLKHGNCFAQMYGEFPLSQMSEVVHSFDHLPWNVCILHACRQTSDLFLTNLCWNPSVTSVRSFDHFSWNVESRMLVVKYPTYFAQILAKIPFSPMFEIAHSFYHLQWNVFILHVCRQVSLLFAQIYIDFAFSLWFKIVRCCNHLTWNNCILHSISSIIGPAFRYV